MVNHFDTKDLDLASWRLEVAERVFAAQERRIADIEKEGGDAAAARGLLAKCQQQRRQYLERYIELRKKLINERGRAELALK